MVHGLRWLVLAIVAAFIVVGVASADSPAVTLVGRAVLPAESYADGPKSGAALADRKTINGIKVPFTTQPLGSVSGLIKGWYKGTWILLTDKGFGTEKSADYLLRAYIVEVDMRNSKNGQGTVNPLDWIGFSDPRKQIQGAITLQNDKARPLTGAEFSPISLVSAADETLWMAESSKPALLHFTREGILLEPPRTVTGGQMEAMGISADKTRLFLGLKNGNTVNIQQYDPAKNQLIGTPLAYPLDNGNSVTDITLINDTQALVVEQDNAQGSAAKSKSVFLFDFTASGKKQLIIDLLNISDPANIGVNSVFGSASGKFGLANPFKFPFDVSAVYPQDNSTFIVVNNNHFPFGTARKAGAADNTELIAVKVNTPLNVQIIDQQE